MTRSPADRMRPPRRHVWAAASGVISAAALLAVTEGVAAIVARESSALLAVGSFVIDIVPRPLKELAITTFGAFDKPALLIGLGLAVVVAAAVAGLLARRRVWLGAALLAVGGALALAAIVTRPGASGLAWLPPFFGTAAGVVCLLLLIERLRRWNVTSAGTGTLTPTTVPAAAATKPAHATNAEQPHAEPATQARLDRRSFFGLAAIVAASAIVVGVGSRLATVATTSLEAVRKALRLPAPRSLVTIPAGAELDVPGLTPLLTPNADFYRVDTALTVPSIDPAGWRLVIDGMVDRRVELSFYDLLAMGVDEYAITLTCV